MASFSRGTIILMTLVSVVAGLEMVHEKGHCLWYGQCTDETCPRTQDYLFYNYFYNGWYKNVTEESDPSFYKLINEVCPMYIDPTDSIAHVCCSQAQITNLKSRIAQAQSLISRCPACLKNFIHHFCITTCDPDSSLFMNGTVKNYTAENGTVYSYVTTATVYLTNKYATDLYNSCANVQFAGGGSKVMNLLCGTSNCNPHQWLKFLGDPSLNGDEAPFPMYYSFYNNSSPIQDGIEPLDDTGNHRFYRCNESVGSLGPCSCSDCPTTCPAPPTFTSPHLPFKIIALSIGITGFVLSVAIFLTALLAAIVVLTLYKRSGYRPISQDSRPSESNYGTTGSTAPKDEEEEEENDSFNSHASINADVHINKGRGGGDDDKDKESLQSALDKCCQIGYVVEQQIQLVFYHWGKFVAKFWYLVLLVSIIIVGGLSFGLFYFTVTTSPVELWSSPSSQARQEMNYFDEHFGPFYRTEQIIVKAKPGVKAFNVTQPYTSNIWTFGPVFNKSVLLEVLGVQNHLANMEVPYNDEGHEKNITLSDICFAPLSTQDKTRDIDSANCTIDSVLNYFQNEVSLLEKTVGFFVDYTSHLHYCTRNPFSPNETQSGFDIPCLGSFGGDVDPNVALGGFKALPDGTGYDYDTATVLIITFVVNNHVSDNKEAMVWERQFLDYLREYKKKAKLIDIEYSAERSIIDEIDRESKTDIYTIAASYLLMFVYITLFLGHIRSIATLLVDLKLIVGLVGVVLVLFAVTSSLGVFSYLHLKASLIVLEVVPFLVLAVGVDNLFILVHSYERQLKFFAKRHGTNWDSIPLPEIIGRTVGDVAPSLLLTGLSETAAFLLGAASIMPAVRSFSLYAGTAVFFNLLLQLSVFVAVLSLDAMRQLGNRVDVLFCLPWKGKFDPLIGRDFLSIIMNYFAKFILYPLVRPFVLLFFGLTLTSSLILMFRLQIGLNQNLALPKDSYLIPYFNELFANLHTGSPVYFVIKDGFNYTSPPDQNEICSGFGCQDDSLGNMITIYARAPEQSGIAESPLNWLDSYFAWISNTGGCCGYLNTTSPPNVTLCDNPENGTECIPCISGVRPNATEFEMFLKYFLTANPSTNCASAGHAAFGDAVILEDNKTVITSYIMTYHSQLQTSADYINALKRARELSANVTKMIGHEVFPYSIFYVYYEQYLSIIPDMCENIGLALLAVFCVSFLLMGLNLWAAIIIVAIVTSIILHMLGSMAVLGINANAVSLVNLVMTVGISVEFCSHIVRWFVSCSLPTRSERAHSALHHMGASVFSGITMTKFLGVFVLLFAKSQLFEIYYFRMYMCMLLWGALHGLVLLPVVLSYIGPMYIRNILKSPYNPNYLVVASRNNSSCFSRPSPTQTTTSPYPYNEKEGENESSPITAKTQGSNNNHVTAPLPRDTSTPTDNYQGYPPPTNPSWCHTTTNNGQGSRSLSLQQQMQQQLYPQLPAYHEEEETNNGGSGVYSGGSEYPPAMRSRDGQVVNEKTRLLYN